MALPPLPQPLIPEKAGIQGQEPQLGSMPPWTPAFAGVSGVWWTLLSAAQLSPNFSSLMASKSWTPPPTRLVV
jgi:hypothetical protein